MSNRGGCETRFLMVIKAMTAMTSALFLRLLSWFDLIHTCMSFPLVFAVTAFKPQVPGLRIASADMARFLPGSGRRPWRSWRNAVVGSYGWIWSSSTQSLVPAKNVATGKVPCSSWRIWKKRFWRRALYLTMPPSAPLRRRGTGSSPWAWSQSFAGGGSRRI